MKLTPEALASVLPDLLSSPLDHTLEDKILADRAIEILFPDGCANQAGAYRVAADLARDFRLLHQALTLFVRKGE